MGWWLLVGLVILLVFPGVRRVLANAAVALVVFVTILVGGLLLEFDAGYVFLAAVAGVGATLLLRRQRAGVAGRSAFELPQTEPEAEPRFDPPGFADEPAWLAFRERLGPGEGARADKALADMAALLSEAKERQPLDPAAEHARRIETDVPEYLRIAMDRLEHATPAEARGYLIRALDRIDVIAGNARAERERMRRADDASFDSYSSYLDQTSARRDG